MKTVSQEEFLTAYKNLEDVLAAKGFERKQGMGLVAQYEDTLGAESNERKGLQQCRIIRNCYQHENRVLFLPTDDAVHLLNGLTKRLDDRATAKDAVSRTKKLLADDRLDVLSDKDMTFVINGGVFPVIDSEGFYLGGIDEHVLVRILFTNRLHQERKTQFKTFMQDPVIMGCMKRAADITRDSVLLSELEDGRTYAVIGTKDKYKGMIQGKR